MKHRINKKFFDGKFVCEENIVFNNDVELQEFCQKNLQYSDWIYYKKNTISNTHWDLEYNEKNIIMLRHRYNNDNPEYATCVMCGRMLHEHNKNDHTVTGFGVVGPECYKKIFPYLYNIEVKNVLQNKNES